MSNVKARAALAALAVLLGGCAHKGDWASVELRMYLNSNASIESKIDAIRDGRPPRGALPLEALPYLMQPTFTVCQAWGRGLVTCN